MVGLEAPKAEQRRRERDLTRVHAVMACLVLLILFQFLMLMVAVDGYLGAGASRVTPTAAASALCFGASLFLVRALVGRRAV